MTTQFLPAVILALSLTACSHRDEDTDIDAKPDAQMAGVHIAKADTAPLAAGDVRIETTDNSVDLLLRGDSISSGLSQSTLGKVKHDTDTMSVKGSGFGAFIEKTVKSSVQGAIGTRASFPVSDIKGARYENGRIEFEWVNGKRNIFDNSKINKRPLLESFNPSDAQRFVEAVNARKGSVAR